MNFTVECPTCKESYNINSKEVVGNPAIFKCCNCGTTPPLDIITAYQNVGKTMLELNGCCNCEDKKGWLPKAIKKI